MEDKSWRDEVYVFVDAIKNNGPILSGTVEEAVATLTQVYRIYWADFQRRERWNILNPDVIQEESEKNHL